MENKNQIEEMESLITTIRQLLLLLIFIVVVGGISIAINPNFGIEEVDTTEIDAQLKQRTQRQIELSKAVHESDSLNKALRKLIEKSKAKQEKLENYAILDSTITTVERVLELLTDTTNTSVSTN